MIGGGGGLHYQGVLIGGAALSGGHDWGGCTIRGPNRRGYTCITAEILRRRVVQSSSDALHCIVHIPTSPPVERG